MENDYLLYFWRFLLFSLPFYVHSFRTLPLCSIKINIKCHILGLVWVTIIIRNFFYKIWAKLKAKNRKFSNIGTNMNYILQIFLFWEILSTTISCFYALHTICEILSNQIYFRHKWSSIMYENTPKNAIKSRSIP